MEYKSEYIDVIHNFCVDCEFPSEAETALVSAFEKTFADREAFSYIADRIDEYEKRTYLPFICVLQVISYYAKRDDISEYTMHLLFYILLSEILHKRYIYSGIPETIFHDSMMDLRWKMNECYNVYGIWGTFAGNWTSGFYLMKLFALGRLQYELIGYPSNNTYIKNGYFWKLETPVLNVHIPSSGSLKEEDCYASYASAKKFYTPYFISEAPIAIVCSSWLLSPYHNVMLPETSNIRRFASDFDLISSEDYMDNNILWRIFGKMDCNDIENLPRKTLLQIKYAERLEKGLPIGMGFGIRII